MIAKGFDIPNVSLVGILMADHGLFSADYLAEERSYQLLTQVSGRAGRGDIPGKVVLQTYVPDHPVIQMAVQQDFVAFYNYEIAHRKESSFPPYRSLIEVECVDTDKKRSYEYILEWKKRYQEDWDRLGIDVLGPSPCIQPKQYNKYHFHLYLIGKDQDITDFLHKADISQLKIKRS